MGERLIGDCLEINADIIDTRFHSKLPKFIANLRAKYYMNKLIKTAEKIAAANTPLDKENIQELAMYLFNNYKPHGEYKRISYTKFMNSGYYIMKLDVAKDFTSIFTIPETGDRFTLNIRAANNDGGFEGYELELKTLATEKDDIKDKLLLINQALVQTISEYVIDTVLAYKKEIK